MHVQTLSTPIPRDESIPRFAALADDASRPFWSVMVPTYNPGELLERTLRSVLEQDPGETQMQIEVIDDASPNVDTAAMVRRIAGDRVGVYRQPDNRGLAGNWNTCIERSRGRWVHILHQDDEVLPGYYEAIGRAVADRADIGAAYCRHYVHNIADKSDWLSPLERDEPGVLDDAWLDRQAVSQQIMFPAICVRRSTYEAVGGFRNDIIFALDWEMWIRIASRFCVWFEPRPLARYNHHAATETSRLKKQGKLVQDMAHAIEIMAASLPTDRRERLRCAALERLNAIDTKWAWWALKGGNVRQARRHAFNAVRRRPLSGDAWKAFLCALRGR